MSQGDPAKLRRYVELAVELSAGEVALNSVEFLRMLIHVHDAAEAVITELHSDGSDAAIAVRFAAELRIYVDDAIRARDGAKPTLDPDAPVNVAAGRVVNYAIALRDIVKHAYG